MKKIIIIALIALASCSLLSCDEQQPENKISTDFFADSLADGVKVRFIRSEETDDHKKIDADIKKRIEDFTQTHKVVKINTIYSTFYTGELRAAEIYYRDK